MPAFNYLAIIVAALASQIIGAVWYSPYLFGKKWIELSGLTKTQMEETTKSDMVKSYILGIINSLVIAFVLSQFILIWNATSAAEGIQIGIWIWVGFIATTMLGDVIWARRSKKLYVINVAYHLVSIATMGAILAVWQ